MQSDPLHMKIERHRIQCGLAYVKIHVHRLFPRHLVAHLKTQRSVRKLPLLATADYTFAQAVRWDPKTCPGKKRTLQMYQFQCLPDRRHVKLNTLQRRSEERRVGKAWRKQI